MDRIPIVKGIKFCKYIEVDMRNLTTKCKFSGLYLKCPPDSGVNSKCDYKCYEYQINN